MQTLSFELMHKDARLPTRGSAGAAGLDLYCVERVDIPPGQQAALPTGLAVAIPRGWYGRIAPRSGLAVKHGVDVHAGVIDSDFRGEMKVALINHGPTLLEFKPGDRIAQLIVERCRMLDPVAVDELPDTPRGAGAFGSTGR